MRQPLIVLLPVQAVLYFWNLGLLSPWFDEAGELLSMRSSLGSAVAVAASGGHPPLYFLITYWWLRLPLGLDQAVQARALSVLFALAATLAADRLWARFFPQGYRWCFLALWTLSPCLLLYARMCRSYSLQLLVATIGAAYILRFAKERTLRNGAILAAALTVALYVHYVPAAALLAATNVTLLRDRRIQDAAALDAFAGISFLPWLPKLWGFLGAWSTHAGYAITGSAATELPVKIGYWAVSFTMGEAMPDAILLAGGLVMIAVAAAVALGARVRTDLVWIAVPMAIIGFIGVSRWVSYPFIPARMLFLFPVFLSLFVAGAASRPRLGVAAVAGMLALSMSGTWCYFHRIDFRNKQYAMPIAEIARLIQHESTPNGSVVLVDSTNSDPAALHYALGESRAILTTRDDRAPDVLTQQLRDARIRTVWFLRNTHDVSAGGLNRQFEQRLRAGMRERVYSYEPLTPLEIWFLRAAGGGELPRYFHELLKFER